MSTFDSSASFPTLEQVGPGNTDMDKAAKLCADHPEVLMFRRRCFGDAEVLYSKAKALAKAGKDQMAIKARKSGKKKKNTKQKQPGP